MAPKTAASGSDDPPRPSRPLAGLRVLDLTNVLAGPYCGHLLAQLGADVVKVESPDGDLARRLGASPEMSRDRMGASFVAQNAGKRSVVLDLKSADGADVFRKLVRRADALVENFRPGVMARLGFGWDALRRENPRLVYCAVSGFGQDGEFADAPAYDQILQGMSGLMRVTGDARSGPLRTGFPVADAVGGLAAAFAIAAALVGRERRENGNGGTGSGEVSGTGSESGMGSGEVSGTGSESGTGSGEVSETGVGAGTGCFIDVSMLESLLSAMGWVVSNCLATGESPVARGNDNPTASPSGTFAASDAPLNIAANKQAQFEALCDLVGLSELKTDSRFAGRESRLANREELTRALSPALATKTAREWADEMRRAGIPAGEVLTVPQALGLAQVSAREFVAEFPPGPSSPSGGNGRTLRAARVGFRINGKTPRADGPPPELNQHADEILSELSGSAKSESVSESVPESASVPESVPESVAGEAR